MPLSALPGFALWLSCCGWRGGKFCCLVWVLFLLLYQAEEITGSSADSADTSWKSNHVFFDRLNLACRKRGQSAAHRRYQIYRSIPVRLGIYLGTATESWELFTASVRSSGGILSSRHTRRRLAVRILVLPIPSIFIRSTSGKHIIFECRIL